MNFPDETGKMSEGQKGGGTAEVQIESAREGSQNDIFFFSLRLHFSDTSRDPSSARQTAESG